MYPRRTGNYWKLNAVTITYAFPLPFVDGILDVIVGHKMYSFFDGFNSYNHISMHPDDEEKITFVMDWGVFITVVMMFWLKISPATFQCIITKIFGEYIRAFMQVFLDDFIVYGAWNEHL